MRSAAALASIGEVHMHPLERVLNSPEPLLLIGNSRENGGGGRPRTGQAGRAPPAAFVFTPPKQSGNNWGVHRLASAVLVGLLEVSEVP